MWTPRLFAAACALALVAGPVMAAEPPSDAFIAGYAAAVVEREFGVKATGLSVVDGHLTFPASAVGAGGRGTLLKSLAAVPGVKDVTLVGDEGAKTVPGTTPIETLSLATPTTAPAPQATYAPAANTTLGGTTVETDDGSVQLYLGAGRTFSPLLADPRWPHLYASYQNFNHDTDGSTSLRNVGSVGFGETIGFLKQSFPNGFRHEVGIQGGLFAIFDLDSDSSDLINADYFVGPYYALRYKDFSLLARVYHQSSHLGDEYVLRADSEERVNYSFETVNLTLSYDLPYGFRVYGGAGLLLDVDPGNVNKGTVQYGLEWISPDPIPGLNWARPVAAVDVKNWANYDWSFSTSVRLGVQLEDPTRFSQRLQIMLEFYDGNNYNGQFYDEHIRYLGVGAHFYF